MPTILITGAGRGLGLEFARQYAGDGWKVIATVREPKAGSALAALGKSVEIHLADMADRKSIAGLAKGLKGAPIDVLICNAGIYPRGASFGHTDYDAWEEAMRVNVFGPQAVAEVLIENVIRSDLKRIVMMSSRMGSITHNDGEDHIYRSSKAALNQVMKGMAADLADRRVTVIAVSPGWVKTDMGGSGAPLTAEPSIKGLRKVIAGMTPKKSGKFFSYDGSEIEW